MGRAPCCDKANVKKGPWSPEEDAKLKSYMDQHGTGGNWIALPQKIGLKRCGKSCRLRWLNYLRPNIKHGGFSEEEDNIICSLYITIGSRWSIIAAQLPGRTDNDIKNYWNTRLKKKLLGKQRKGKQAQKGREPATARGNQNSSANTVPNYSLICPHPAAARGLQPQPPVLPPIPYSNEEPRFNEHGSIRKLLIKLGGRFSDGNQIDGEQFKLMCPVISEPLIQPAYCNSMDLISNSAQIPSLHATPAASSSVPNGSDLSSMLPGASVDWSSEAMECLMYENPQKLQGLEFFYDDVINNTINGTAESMDWGEMSSLVFAPSASHNNEGFLHAPATTPPEEELVAESMMRYPGTH